VRVGALAFVVLASSCSSFATNPSQGDAGLSPSDAAAPQLDASTDATTTDRRNDSAYVQAVLADGPIGYWRLGEQPGATKAKSEYTGADGTISGLPKLGVPGALANSSNTAYEFKGDGNDGIDLGPAFFFAQRTQYSLEAWLNLTEVDSNDRYLFTKLGDTSATGLEGYAIHTDPGKGLAFDRYVAGAALGVAVPIGLESSNAKVRLKTWHHVVATYDSDKLILYVDGVAVSTTPDAREHGASVIPAFQIGRKVFGGGGLAAVVDEAAVYNKALLVERIQAHHKLGRGL
jgi:hypothetical protein